MKMNELFFLFLGVAITISIVLMLWIVVGAYKGVFSYVYFLIGFATALCLAVLIWGAANTSVSFNKVYNDIVCDSVTLPTNIN